MKNRTVKISAVALGVLIIGGLLPRIMLYNTVRKLTCIDIKAEYFTDFSVTYNGDVQTIDNGGVSLKIPAYYKQCEDDPKHYSGDDNEEVFYYDGLQKYEADLLDTEVFKDIKGLYSVGKIKRGFEKLGHGIPDSTYNTHKCILLTDSNDYSFWDMEKGRSFVVTAAAKELVYEDYI